MFGLGAKIRWALITIGVFIVLLGIAEYNGLFDAYPAIKKYTFPFMWIVGALLIIAGYGFEEKSEKPNGSCGVDGAPGMGERKKGVFGDGPFGGDGGSDGGGGGD